MNKTIWNESKDGLLFSESENEAYEDGIRTGYTLAAWMLRRMGIPRLADALIEQSRATDIYPEGYLRKREGE